MAKKTTKHKVTPRKTSRSKAKADPAAATAALRQLKLAHVRLLDLVAHLEIKGSLLPEEAQLSTHVGVGIGPDEPFIHVDGLVTVNGRPPGASNAKDDGSILVIQVHCQCVFMAPEGSDRDQFMKYNDALAQSGMTIMWPHFREVVQSVSSRMGIDPFILPMLVGGRVAKEEEKKKAKTKP